MHPQACVSTTAQSRSEGEAASAQLNALPWVERFTLLGDMVKNVYLPRYEELATLVTPEEDPDAAALAEFMGRHERALVEVSDNIVSGRENPVAPVIELLAFPLLRVSGPA